MNPNLFSLAARYPARHHRNWRSGGHWSTPFSTKPIVGVKERRRGRHRR